MDGYEAELIARGPTFTTDGETLTGSVHIDDLPDPAAARAFGLRRAELPPAPTGSAAAPARQPA
ncbi:hypothetical protein [Streptomyces shaanxiensis]